MLLKKNHRVDRFTIYIYIYYHKMCRPKYSYSLSIKNEHAHEVVVKKWRLQLAIHLTINVKNKLFILITLENNYRFAKQECSSLELVN